MSNQINDLLQDSQAQFRAQRNETKGLVTKWEKTGLLEGIGEEYNKHNTAILLENQAKQLISEANNTAAGAADWNGVALPLVRRIFGELSAKEFVSVQPMNLPSGLVFWLDFKYGGDSGGTGKGRHVKGDSLFGNTTDKGKAQLDNGLYTTGTGSMGASPAAGYSLNKVKIAMTGSDIDNTNFLDFDSALAGGTPQDVDYDLAGAFYLVGGSSGTEVFTASHVGHPLNVPTDMSQIEFTGLDGDKVVAADFNNVGGVSAAAGHAFYYKNTLVADRRGDFEDKDITEMGASTGTDLEIPELEVQLTQEALVAKTRKLKVKWSPEFAQDLNAYHSIDAEAELTSMLSEYITMEIDMEILSMLQVAAKQNGFNQIFTAPGIGTAGVTYNELFGLLGVQMQAMSNAIHQSTMRGGANFAVCSPQVATYLESIAGFTANTDGTAANFAMGVTAIGSMSNRWTIYKNPYWTGKDILMGFRGSQFLETGAVFAPYIPLIMTPLVYDPTNFTPRKGVMTRYAKKVVRNDFYGVITVDSTNWDSVSTLPS